MRRAGFTLIELLVVIAIIAILAAILFPIFSQAKERGKEIRCLTHAKQIGSALQAYIGDNNGVWPSFVAFRDAYPSLNNTNLDYGRMGSYQYGGMAKVLQKYSRDYKIFWCPNDRVNKPYVNDYVWTSMIYRGVLGAFTMPTSTSLSDRGRLLTDSMFARPTKTVAYHEIRAYHHGMHMCWQGYQNITGQPILIAVYADGHAKLWRVPKRAGDTPYDANWFTNCIDKKIQGWAADPRYGWDD